MFHVSLALNGRADVGMTLYVYEPRQPVSLGEPADQTFPMLPDAPKKIGRDAEIQDPVRPIGHYVNPGLDHDPSVGSPYASAKIFVDGRDKPGHDGLGSGKRQRESKEK
jgi:hypothetical protein